MSNLERISANKFVNILRNRVRELNTQLSNASQSEDLVTYGVDLQPYPFHKQIKNTTSPEDPDVDAQILDQPLQENTEIPIVTTREFSAASALAALDLAEDLKNGKSLTFLSIGVILSRENGTRNIDSDRSILPQLTDQEHTTDGKSE